jgi:hypothetical protein
MLISLFSKESYYFSKKKLQSVAIFKNFPIFVKQSTNFSDCLLLKVLLPTNCYMKRIRPNKLITTTLYDAVGAIARNGQLTFSKHLLFSFITRCITDVNSNTSAIIDNDLSTTIQMPK